MCRLRGPVRGALRPRRSGPGQSREKREELIADLRDPWSWNAFSQVTGTPMAAALYEACSRVDAAGTAKRERLLLKHTQAVLGTRDVADVFMRSVDG